MDFFCADTKLVDLIHTDYRLLPVLNRLGVELGFGDLSVGEVCEQKGLNVGFFLSIVNLYHNENLISEKEFLKYPLNYLISYLKRSHDHYRDNVISKHYRFFQELKVNGFKDVEGIESIYSLYSKEVDVFIEHMEYEDNVVFPYLLSISAGNEKEFGSIRERILDEFDEYHDDLVDQLYDMKNILLKYLATDINSNICNDFLFSIFEFTKDLTIHSKIEDSVLLEYIKN